MKFPTGDTDLDARINYYRKDPDADLETAMACAVSERADLNCEKLSALVNCFEVAQLAQLEQAEVIIDDAMERIKKLLG